ncbi:LytR/AlgR family response regulator transcription factor [Paraflavitalea pollutisoli]|uniref:LytR/AlgR family response regulator transcription factor n=1 Tax=Paraflavitalea pollutisoli TaxID=3034143 RepID=UPI0023EBAB7E|nr:LytTR family DNA-binding domain-containing protein [Paraflavitalea sp. H1-2-19X]
MLRPTLAYPAADDDTALPDLSLHETFQETIQAPALQELVQSPYLRELADLLSRIGQPTGKTNFLVHKNNKYINVTTESIAYFYVKYDTTIIVTFGKQEYFVDHSLEEIEQLLQKDQFFRLNRQYLVHFSSIREVEHYFARKLLVNLTVPTKEKLLVSKRKAATFLHWLDNR